MKKTIISIILLFTIHTANCQVSKQGVINDSLKKEFQQGWNSFKNFVLNKNNLAIINLFTDSLKKIFSDFEEKDLKSFISKKWINDKVFIKAIKNFDNTFQRIGKASFEMQIVLNYPKR